MLAKRFFAQSVLLDQAWVHDPNLTVGQALAEHGAEVVGHSCGITSAASERDVGSE